MFDSLLEDFAWHHECHIRQHRENGSTNGARLRHCSSDKHDDLGVRSIQPCELQLLSERI